MDIKLIGLGYGLYIIEHVSNLNDGYDSLYEVAISIEKNCLKVENEGRLIISCGGINKEERLHKHCISGYEEVRDLLLSMVDKSDHPLLSEKIRKIEEEYEAFQEK